MSETVIPSGGRVVQPALNQKYVNSRQGASNEQNMTKNASIKHHNPEYFKRQSDQKNKIDNDPKKYVPELKKSVPISQMTSKQQTSSIYNSLKRDPDMIKKHNELMKERDKRR